jgi:hypothetical protein
VYYECLATGPDNAVLYGDQPAPHNPRQLRIAYLRNGQTAGIFCSQPPTPKTAQGNTASVTPAAGNTTNAPSTPGTTPGATAGASPTPGAGGGAAGPGPSTPAPAAAPSGDTE